MVVEDGTIARQRQREGQGRERRASVSEGSNETVMFLRRPASATPHGDEAVLRWWKKCRYCNHLQVAAADMLISFSLLVVDRQPRPQLALQALTTRASFQKMSTNQ